MLTDLPQMNDAELENFVQAKGSFECEGTTCKCCVSVQKEFVPGSPEGQYKVLSVIVILT